MRSLKRSSCLALVLAAGMPACLVAADNQAIDRRLELKSGLVDTRVEPNLISQKGAFARGRFVLQLDGPMTAQREAQLRAAGVSLDGYLPVNAYIVRLDAVRPGALSRLGFIAWVGEFQNEWKLDPALGRRMFNTMERRELAALGRSQVVIHTFADLGPEELQARIALIGGEQVGAARCGRHWLVEAALPTDMVAGLSELPSVQFIEEATEIELRNGSNRWIVQSNITNSTPVWDRGIHGEGQVAGLIDGTVRESHCMFDDSVAVGPSHRKIIAARGAGSNNTHGTHCAGTIAGDNAPYGVYTTNDGLAYAAKLSTTNSSLINSTSLLPNLLAAHNDGARCHSNSWGDDGTTAYTSHCQQIDQFTWDNEDNVVAFAVTNTSSLKTPENSVNVLAVGASQDSPNQGNHCSGGTGPTADGRRKPEIYAPGCGTTSASNSTCSTTNLTGTSMACPAIIGAAVLVRQYFTDGFYPSGAATPANSMIPSGALLKAVLLSGTVDMTGPAGFPSNQEGFGRLILDNALYFSGDSRDLQVIDVRKASGLSTGQQSSHPVTVLSSSEPLRIVLSYTAPPATVNASNPVINNLDLEVTGPGGLYLGNVLTSGQSVNGGTADAKNNVEMVILNVPVAGEYTVKVKATAVGVGPQGYALAMTGDLGTASGGCYPNCDGSTASPILTANDFQCFLNAFAAGESYANCDGSSTSPVLTANDFQCFVNAFAAGCP